MIKIGAIHSGSANMAPILEKALAPRFEEFEILNVIDDTLIKTVIRDQTLTTRTVKRVADLSEALILAGADVVFKVKWWLTPVPPLARRRKSPTASWKSRFSVLTRP